jgi:hypothetical protein
MQPERETSMDINKCQIHFLNEMAEPGTFFNVLYQRHKRIKRIFKRRMNYLMNMLNEMKEDKMSISEKVGAVKGIRPETGDRVRVKSREDIQKTLNRWNQLRGCSFMEEMWPYCGTEQRILKRIEKFLDERDYIIKKCKGIVILDGVFCEGTKDFGPCDRTCFFFWREEWLEKIP